MSASLGGGKAASSQSVLIPPVFPGPLGRRWRQSAPVLIVVLIVVLRGWSPEEVIAMLCGLAMVQMVLKHREQLA